MFSRLIIILILFGIQVSWGSDSFSYSGRLVNADGSPVTGLVNLRAELAYSNSTSTILCSQDHTGVSLTNGVFHIKLDLNCSPKTITQILAETPATHSVAIRITDLTHAKVYSFQALHSMPYANVSKQLVQMGATDGQVLTWDNGEWKPLAPSGTSSGSIGTTELADGSVTDPKVASGISRSKLATGAVNYVLVNDSSSGLVSEVPYLSITQGGTGATTVAGIFTNLGLGTAATADLGLTTGNALAFDDVKFCLPTQKLMLTALPTVQWICEEENTSNDTTKLPLAGGTMTGDINMGTHRIIGLETPVDPDEAVNKAYVDTLSESNWKSSGTNAYYNNTGNVGIGVATPAEKLDVVGNVALTGGLRFRSGTNYVELKAPALASNVLLVLPAADGSAGQVLKTDGAGNLGWVDATAGSITSVTATLPLTSTTSSGSTTLAINYDGSTIGMNGSNQLHVPNGGITNTQINASAAIDWTKINKTGSASSDIGAASELVSITAGTGLLGGGTLEASRTLSVNVGTSANQIVQMDATGKLPAIDGSQLTNLPLKWVDATGGINYPSGNVGIGTSTPNNKLEVVGDTLINGLKIKSLGGSGLAGRWFKVARIQNTNPIDGAEVANFTGQLFVQDDYYNTASMQSVLTFSFGVRGGAIQPILFNAGKSSTRITQDKWAFQVWKDSSDWHHLYFYQSEYSSFARFMYQCNSCVESWVPEDPSTVAGSVKVWDSLTDTAQPSEFYGGFNVLRGNVGVGNATPGFSLDLGTRKDAIKLPIGTTAERPATPANGLIRYNSDNNKLEAYVAGMWQDLAAAATGGTYLSTGGGTLSGALTISSGGADITGGINANSGAIINTGNITGSSALTVAAGGTNQNLTLNSSGTGSVNIGSGGGTALTVLSNGNVGIGTTVPDEKLEVVGAIEIAGNELADQARLHIAASDKSNRFTLESDLDSSTNNDLLGFRSTTADNILVLKGNGNVGIGTTSAAEKLTVNNGNLYLNGSVPYIYWDSNALRLKSKDNVIPVLELRGSTTYGSRLDMYTAGDTTKNIVFDSGGASYFNGGNVGIGTTTPQNKLHINDTGANSVVLQFTNADTGQVDNLTGGRVGLTSDEYMSIVSGTNGNGIKFFTNNSNRMTIDTLGNVGIGTTTPSSALQIVKSDSDPQIKIKNESSTSDRYPGMKITNFMGTGNGFPMIFMSNIGGSSGGPTATGAERILGSVIGAGYDGAGGWPQGARMDFVSESAFTGTSDPTYIKFATTSTNQTSTTEKMRITADGNVGIGTAAPTAKLEVAGDIKAVSGGRIGVTKVNGTFGPSTTNIPTATWTYIGDHITLTPGDWVVYYETFYDHDGTTAFNFSSYNHPFLSTDTTTAGTVSKGNLNSCSQSHCPIKSTYQVSVSTTTTYYIVHLLTSYSGTHVKIRSGWGNFYALKVN